MKRQKQPWPDHLADYLVTEITARDESVKKPKPPKHGGCAAYLLPGLVLVAAILAVVATWGGAIAGALGGIG